MLDDLKDLEAIEIGLNLEKDGINFYTAAAEKIEDQNPKVAAILRQFAEDEEKHYRDFLRKRNELTNNQTSGHSKITQLVRKLGEMYEEYK